MPFDPAKPVNGSAMQSAEMRDQLNGLKEIIDAQAATIANQALVLADLQSQIDNLSDAVNDRVTTQAFNDAIASQTAGLPGNDVEWTDGFSNPLTAEQIQPFVDVYNQLVNYLRRN